MSVISNEIITQRCHSSTLWIIDRALSNLDDGRQEKTRFLESCFGHFMRMHHDMTFSSVFVHELLLREIWHDGLHDEMRFLLDRHTDRLSRVEFCLIIGLKVGKLPDTSHYGEMADGIYRRYFNGRDDVTIENMKEILELGQFGAPDDALKMSLILMLHRNTVTMTMTCYLGCFDLSTTWRRAVRSLGAHSYTHIPIFLIY
ncbi:hypothetical protein ACOSP7_004669 [Xanthoceras sorbifolium]